VRRELSRANIKQGEKDDIQCIELLGEGAYGKVGRSRGGAPPAPRLSAAPPRDAALARRPSAWPEAPPCRPPARPPPPPTPAPASTPQVYKGLWKGTIVAIKSVVLPANMSGAEKREKMAVMEAAVRRRRGAGRGGEGGRGGGRGARVGREKHARGGRARRSLLRSRPGAGADAAAHPAAPAPPPMRPPDLVGAVAPQHHGHLHLRHPRGARHLGRPRRGLGR
jgi:hypothetical protein